MKSIVLTTLPARSLPMAPAAPLSRHWQAPATKPATVWIPAGAAQFSSNSIGTQRNSSSSTDIDHLLEVNNRALAVQQIHYQPAPYAGYSNNSDYDDDDDDVFILSPVARDLMRQANSISRTTCPPIDSTHTSTSAATVNYGGQVTKPVLTQSGAASAFTQVVAQSKPTGGSLTLANAKIGEKSTIPISTNRIDDSNNSDSSSMKHRFPRQASIPPRPNKAPEPELTTSHRHRSVLNISSAQLVSSNTNCQPTSGGNKRNCTTNFLLQRPGSAHFEWTAGGLPHSMTSTSSSSRDALSHKPASLHHYHHQESKNNHYQYGSRGGPITCTSALAHYEHSSHYGPETTAIEPEHSVQWKGFVRRAGASSATRGAAL